MFSILNHSGDPAVRCSRIAHHQNSTATKGILCIAQFFRYDIRILAKRCAELTCKTCLFQRISIGVCSGRKLICRADSNSPRKAGSILFTPCSTTVLTCRHLLRVRTIAHYRFDLRLQAVEKSNLYYKMKQLVKI